MSCNACHPLGQFFCVYSTLIVHEVICDALGDVVLILMVQYLVIDLSFGSFQLLVCYFIGVF